MSEFKLYVYDKTTKAIISGYNGIDISGNSYTITGLTDNTEYTIKMRRYDNDGNLSNVSKMKDVITDNATIPNVLVTNESFASFRVYFDTVNNASGYLVYLSKDGSPVDNYNPYNSNTNDFAITGLIPESTYSFYIKTAYGGKTSQPSNTYNAITESVNLDNPSNLTISNVNYRNSTITWDNVTDATHYDIYIENITVTGINEYWDQTTLTGNSSFPVSVTGSNNYTFDNGTPLQPFRYYVKARYYQYESDYIQSTSGSFSIVPNVIALEESNVGTSGFTVNWNKVLDIGSVKNSGYYVYLYKDSILQNTIVLTNQDNSTNNSFMNGSNGFVILTNGMSSLTGANEVMYILKPNGSYETNLEILENTTYTYKIKAHHQFIASSDFSNEISVTTNTNAIPLVEKIIYSEQAINGNHRLVKANNDNTSKVYLTPDTYMSIYPDVSKDGKKLAFIKEYSATKSDIMVYDLETNTITNLTNFATDNNYVWSCKWNSNDSKILYSYHNGARVSAIPVLKEINVTTLSSTTLYTDTGANNNISPEYSLDDNIIYFTDASFGLVKYNIATSTKTNIIGGNHYFPSKHPIQNKILYSSIYGSPSNYQIVERNLDTSTDIAIFTASSYNFYPKYSPDGNSAIWMSYETGTWQLRKKNLLTNTVTNITNDLITYHYPEWANVLDNTTRAVLDIQVNNSSVYDNSNLEHTVTLIGSPSIISTASGYAINLDSGNKAIKISDNSDFEFSNHHTGLYEFRKDNSGTIRAVSKDSGGEQYRFGILTDGSMFWIFASNNYPSTNPAYLKFNTTTYSWVIGRIYKMAWCLDLDLNTFKILIKDTVTNVITDLSYTIETGVQYYSNIADFTEIRNGNYDLYIGNDSSSNQPIGAVYNYKLFDRAIDDTGLNVLLS